MKVILHCVKGDHYMSFEFDDLQEMAFQWPKLEAQGIRPYFKALRDDVAVKVTDDIFSKMDALDTQETGPSCPIHGTQKIWTDKADPRKHYCGVKNGDKWCGYKWDQNGRMIQPKGR